MLARVARVPAPLEIPLTDVTLNDILHHAPREEAVELSFEEGKVEGRSFLWLHRVEEDSLLVRLAPPVCPVIPHARHVHSTRYGQSLT